MKILLLIGFASVLALAIMGMAADSLVGTWQVNVAKSTFSGPAPKSSIGKIESVKEGQRIVQDTVTADGKVTHNDFILPIDGKEHSVTGSRSYDTWITTRPDANSTQTIYKKDGKVVGKRLVVVSKDGKTMTNTLTRIDEKGKEATTVTLAERQ